MSKYYSSPEMEIRIYRTAHGVFTDSDPGLHDGDEYDLDAVGEPTADDLFAE